MITLGKKLDRIYQFMKKIGFIIEKLDVISKLQKNTIKIPLN